MRIAAGICLLVLSLHSQAGLIQPFISEIHYDNAGGDVDEFVEITASSGTSLDGWTVAFYNGSNGSVYLNLALSGVIAGTDPWGALAFSVSGIQNGGPDGLALVDPSGVATEFISYEGVFNATGGPADGMTSIDILIEEGGSTAIGESLQRTGSLAEWRWAAGLSSMGSINSGLEAPSVGAVTPAPTNGTVPLPPTLWLILVGVFSVLVAKRASENARYVSVPTR